MTSRETQEYEHHAGGDLEFDVHSIGGGVVDTIPTPATVLSQLSKQDLLRETYSLTQILMCHRSAVSLHHSVIAVTISSCMRYVDPSKFCLSAHCVSVIIGY